MAGCLVSLSFFGPLRRKCWEEWALNFYQKKRVKVSLTNISIVLIIFAAWKGKTFQTA